MKKRTARVFIWTLFLLLMSVPAYAITIGGFSWEEKRYDPDGDGNFDFSAGPVFSVENFSEASFFDIFIDLRCNGDCRRDDSADDWGTYEISLGDIPSGNPPWQSLEDFSDADIFSASLRITFPLPGLISVPDLSPSNLFDIYEFDIFTGQDTIIRTASAPIDYSPLEGTVPVPEASTLLLLSSGLAGMALLRQKIVRG